MLQSSLPEHEFLNKKSVLRKNQQIGQDNCNDEKRQPMKISCQTVAMTTETDRLLPKDNNLKSPQ